LRALIYCAGLGTRLGEITKDKAKCMIDVAGKPCLEWIVEKLESEGIGQIIVNTHWKPLDIMEHFSDRLLYTFEPELLGEKQTLERLCKWLKGEFVVVCNGDTLSEIDLGLMVNIAMNRDCNVRFANKDKYAGYTVLHPDYFYGNRKFTNLITPAYWVDIGTPVGLAEARKHYGKIKE
jgi:D-glycero-alpha-D-manno-heptose 1-phosphate guanylyltransferase